MSGLNLSDWALKHRSFIVFIMVAVTLAGVASFFSLGRAEDPPFTFRTMIVQAGVARRDAWTTRCSRSPNGSSASCRRRRGLDFLRSYTMPGPDDDLRQPEGLDQSLGSAGHLVSGAQEHRRHPRHAAGGRGRARLQRRLRRHVRPDLRLHRRRLHPPRTARLCRGHPLAALAGSGRLEDRAPRRAGRADLRRVLDRAAGGPRHRPRGADRGAQAQNAVSPGGRARRPATRRSSLRVSGAFGSEAGPSQRQFPVRTAG